MRQKDYKAASDILKGRTHITKVSNHNKINKMPQQKETTKNMPSINNNNV